MRYFLDISYRGTSFSGWQSQKNARSVQEEIEKSLKLLFRQEISILGSGRTDAGVHAFQQIAHFDSDEIKDISLIKHKLNAMLDSDISINKLFPVKEEKHARFDAIARTYIYLIHQHKNPFKKDLSYFFSPQIDVELINRASEIIRGHQNFECFSKVHTEVNHFNCDIYEAHWMEDAGEHVFRIKANRFLRGMVRAVVGTLLDIGLKKITLEDLKKILDSKDRSKAGRAVPPDGLYLTKVDYPDTIYLD
jgi:tRNA pseudouridine38-40 synthase